MISEAYSGSALVGWHGKIERHLVDLRAKYDSQHNAAYRDKIDEFLRIWRSYPITGSLNIEELTPLEASASTLAVDNWKLSSYFTSVRDQLRTVIASQQELPDLGTDFKPTGRSTHFSPAPPRPPSSFGAETAPGDAEKFEPDVKFNKAKASASADAGADAGADTDSPEPEFKESIMVARELVKRIGTPIPVSVIQESRFSDALKQGWLTYSTDTGYYYVSKIDEVIANANDYNIGDTVVTTHNGKAVTGTVSRKKPDGSYELSFSTDTRDKPDSTKSFTKDQIRHGDKNKPGTGFAGQNPAHNLYGV